MKRNGLATIEPEVGTELVVKKTITQSAAIDIVKKLAADKLREAKTAQRQQEKKISAEVGGNISAFDETVVKQARNLMQRIALIAKHLDKSSGVGNYYGGGSSESKPGGKLRKIVEQLGGIVGQLEVILLADPTIGLFTFVEEKDYIEKHPGGIYNQKSTCDPIDYIPEKNDALRAEAEALLATYDVVPDVMSNGLTTQLVDEAAGVYGAKKQKAAQKKIAEHEARQAKSNLNITKLQDEEAQRNRDAAALREADAETRESAYVDDDGETHYVPEDHVA